MCGALVRAMEDETFRDQLVVLAIEHELEVYPLVWEDEEGQT